MTPADLKTLRTALGMTQSALATKLGVSIRAIQMWEAGDRKIPTLAHECDYCRIARILAELEKETAAAVQA